jgi:taurine dioxygenase
MAIDTQTSSSAAATLRIVPSGSALAADIEGVDLNAPLDAATMAAIKQAWNDHSVLRFRGQHLDDAHLMAFSEHFGTLDGVPIAAGHANAQPQTGFVTVISNIIIDGKQIGGLGAYESIWHTDMSYNERPPYASFLFSIEVPPSGGDTGFANMSAAYDALPEDLKARIEGLGCKHDASRNSAGELRRGYSEVSDPRDAPGAVHPIAVRHPVTGKRCLYLGRRKNASIPGLSLEDSESLLDALWAHATQPRFTWYQQWRVGDLVMWDNFATMHRRDAFDPDSRRLMRRTQVSGLSYQLA